MLRVSDCGFGIFWRVWCAVPPRHKLTTFYRCVRICRSVHLYIIGMVGRRRTISAKISTQFTANTDTLILLAVWGNASFSRPFHIDYRQGIVRTINSVQPESLSREDELFRLFQVTPDPNTADAYRGYYRCQLDRYNTHIIKSGLWAVWQCPWVKVQLQRRPWTPFSENI